MSTYNILEDDIYGLIKKIAIPASIGSLFTTLYNVVDTIFAGKVGTAGEGLAGVSITFPLFLLLLSISIGLGAGTTTLVGNAIGAKENKNAREITYNSFILATIMSILSVVILYPMLPGILRFLKVSEEVLPYSLSYIRVIYIGIFTFTISGVANSVLSAQGQTKPYRNILIIGFFLNIILDPLFLGKNPLYFIELALKKIFSTVTFGNMNTGIYFSESLDIFPNMGTAGIALATILIQLFQTIYIVIKLIESPLFHCQREKGEFKFDYNIIKELLKQGLPAMLNMITVTTGIFILNYFVSYIGGSNATAALGIGYRVEQIVMLPASGIYIAMMAIIAQNRGAEKYDRVYETFKKGFILSVGLLTLGSIIVFIIKLSLISLFTNNKNIIRLTIEYLNIEVFTIPAYAVLSSSINTLQAIKLPKVPMYATLVRQFFMPLTLYTLVTFVFQLPIRFIWICVFINAWSVSLFLMFYARRQVKKI
ncbi:MATE family efflux transporter [Psychrilyobacter atlanticus]|uniref:MATE family efflux transporter n=1 Tax=Psychrilyobacter atlanticus TaxID=271091 RepID=UPI000401ED2B|nr:MATE family efflux transporter [Psychrilyobacter atlanticus]